MISPNPSVTMPGSPRAVAAWECPGSTRPWQSPPWPAAHTPARPTSRAGTVGRHPVPRLSGLVSSATVRRRPHRNPRTRGRVDRLAHHDVEADRDDRHHRELGHGAAEADSRCVEERWRKQRRQGEQAESEHTEYPLLHPAQARPPPAQPSPGPAGGCRGSPPGIGVRHALAFPRLSPSIPVGRISSTRTNRTKATTSRH